MTEEKKDEYLSKLRKGNHAGKSGFPCQKPHKKSLHAKPSHASRDGQWCGQKNEALRKMWEKTKKE